MTLDLAKLKEAAEKATPGMWYALRNQGNRWTAYRETANVIGPKDDDGCTSKICLVNGGNLEDAAYIALANPAAILALIERLESAEGALIGIEEYWNGASESAVDAAEEMRDRARAHLDRHNARP